MRHLPRRTIWLPAHEWCGSSRCHIRDSLGLYVFSITVEKSPYRQYDRCREVDYEDAMKTRTELFRLNGAVVRDPAIDSWMKDHAGELGIIAQKSFEVMRECGDEVQDAGVTGCSDCMSGRYSFWLRQRLEVARERRILSRRQYAAGSGCYRLLQGTGKFMRHVKLKTRNRPRTPGVAGELHQTGVLGYQSTHRTGCSDARSVFLARH